MKLWQLQDGATGAIGAPVENLLHRILLVGDMKQVPEGEWSAPLILSHLISFGKDAQYAKTPVWLLVNKMLGCSSSILELSTMMRFALPFDIFVLATAAHSGAVLMVASGTKGKRFVAPDGLFTIRSRSSVLEPFYRELITRPDALVDPSESDIKGLEGEKGFANDTADGSDDAYDPTELGPAEQNKTGNMGNGTKSTSGDPELQPLSTRVLLESMQATDALYHKFVKALKACGNSTADPLLDALLNGSPKNGVLFELTPELMVKYGFADAIMGENERGILFPPAPLSQEKK